MNPKLAFPLLFVAIVLFLPYVVLACTPNSNVWNTSILKGPLVTCTGAGAVGGTDAANCKDLCDLICTSANVVYFGIGVVIWIVAPIMIAWSGIMLLISRGSPEKTSQARKMITGTVIGLLIVLCAYLVVYTFVSVLKISGVGGFSNPACVIGAPPPVPTGVGVTGGGGTPGGTGACLLTPLAAITDPQAQQMENGQTVLWNSSDPNVEANLEALNKALSDAKNVLAQKLDSVTVNSVYRPLAYQAHLYDIYQHELQLRNNPSAANISACASLISALKAEEQKHGVCSGSSCLVAAPSCSAPHVLGVGVDLSLSGPVALGAVNDLFKTNNINLQWRALVGDPVHFQLINPPFTSCSSN